MTLCLCTVSLAVLQSRGWGSLVEPYLIIPGSSGGAAAPGLVSSKTTQAVGSLFENSFLPKMQRCSRRYYAKVIAIKTQYVVVVLW